MDERFSRTALLLGETELEKLAAAQVAALHQTFCHDVLIHC